MTDLQNGMGAPRVPGNFVAILTGPSLYLGKTEVREAKASPRSHGWTEVGGTKLAEPMSLP